MNTFYQYWKAGLDSSFVDNIKAYCLNLPSNTATIGIEGSDVLSSKRNSITRWVDPDNSQSRFITDMLWSFTQRANMHAFGFNIDYLRDIQFTEYNTGCYYDWHYDTFWANPTVYDRKLSVVIQLSNSSEYDGGDFEFGADVPSFDSSMLRDKGTVLVFPSFLSHRVTPVTRGTRYSLVTWVQGPKFR